LRAAEPVQLKLSQRVGAPEVRPRMEGAVAPVPVQAEQGVPPVGPPEADGSAWRAAAALPEPLLP
jgi:hypothetical protein